MIRLQDMTPDVYYNQSRDFQFIGRLYDIVLNAVKTNVDLIQECPLSDNLDNRLMDLVALTLGFKSKHNYNINQLAALCTTFMKILKNKGNIKSIELAITTLFQAENIDQNFYYELNKDNTILSLFIPGSLSDINLFKDLLNYILPAGMSTRIIRTYLVEKEQTMEFATNDNVKYTTQGNMTTMFRQDYNTRPYPDNPGTIPSQGETDHNKIPTVYRDSIYSNTGMYRAGEDTEPSNTIHAVDTTDNNNNNNQEPEGE